MIFLILGAIAFVGGILPPHDYPLMDMLFIMVGMIWLLVGTVEVTK